MAPHLTKISRSYCEEEFILDTDHLLKHIHEFNETQLAIPKNKRHKLYLSTLDVAALYPSIKPEEALRALETAFINDQTTEVNIKEAL